MLNFVESGWFNEYMAGRYLKLGFSFKAVCSFLSVFYGASKIEFSLSAVLQGRTRVGVT